MLAVVFMLSREFMLSIEVMLFIEFMLFIAFRLFIGFRLSRAFRLFVVIRCGYNPKCVLILQQPFLLVTPTLSQQFQHIIQHVITISAELLFNHNSIISLLFIS